MAEKGDWVRIHQVVLTPDQRAPQVPEDTARVPLEMWVKGWLLHAAQPGDTARVRTRTGREVSGTLLDGQTGYTHSFGDPVPELMHVAQQVHDRLFGGRHEG